MERERGILWNATVCYSVWTWREPGNKHNIPLERGRKRGQTETKWDRDPNRNTMKDSERGNRLTVTVTRGRHSNTSCYTEKKLYTKNTLTTHTCRPKQNSIFAKRRSWHRHWSSKMCQSMWEPEGKAREQHVNRAELIQGRSLLLWFSPFLIWAKISCCLI